MTSTTVVLLSGGLDSTTLLARALHKGPVLGLSINYGQRHRDRELAAAAAIAQYYNIPHEVLTIPKPRGSVLHDTQLPVPEGHYADESMKATVSPNRNMVLLSIAAAYAIGHDADTIAYAAHAGDHAIYPDCRPEFAVAMQEVLRVCHYTPIRLWVPFLRFTKTDIAAHAKALSVPVHLTYSCYNGRELHCGKCGTCVERKEALTLGYGSDPTQYEA